MKRILVPVLFLLIMAGVGCSSDKNDKAIENAREVTLMLVPGINNPRNSEGDFITLKDGRILFVYTHFTGDSFEDHAPAYLAGRFSADSGKTWTKEDQTIVSNDGGLNVMSVSLVRLNNGNIALFYVRKNSMTDCIPLVRISTDEAQTWSEPIPCISDQKGYFTINNNRVIVLNNGRLLMPVSRHQRNNEPFNYKGTSMCYISDDNGVTWKSSKTVPNPNNVLTQEPGVIALKNGKIMMLMRTEENVQYMSLSKDSGMTWTPIAPTTISSPLSPASISRIPLTGDLMLVWNDNNGSTPATKTRRTPFNIALSKDDGNTWMPPKTIENNPDGSYCYTAIHYVGRYVLLSYCAGSYSQRTPLSVTCIARVKLSYLYDRK